MSFAERVYEVLKTVPKGKVTTYKSIANKLGTKAYRLVGQALRNNPYAPVVPCHRVVCSDGRIGGFMGDTKGESVSKKITLLNSEGVSVKNGRVENFGDVMMVL